MSKRKISDLCKLDGRIYLWFRDRETEKQFLADAEAEGYHYGDGKPLGERDLQFCMALNDDHTINFLGFAGFMAFQVADSVGDTWDKERKRMVPGRKLIRVDYEKYRAGEEDYIIPKGNVPTAFNLVL